MFQKSMHKIWALSLAFLVLMSTTSFTINQRFCGEDLLQTSLFTALKSCTDTGCTLAKVANEASTEVTLVKNCCKETTKFVKAQERLTQKENLQKTVEKTACSVKVYTSFLVSSTSFSPQTKQYQPPVRNTPNFQVYYQSFLI